jgi:hypothetical protein
MDKIELIGSAVVAAFCLSFWIVIAVQAYKKLYDWDSWLPLDIDEGLVEVEGVGMGCLLMKSNIFDKLDKPYFEFTYNQKDDNWMGEDFQLLTKLRNVGYKVMIDTSLTHEIGHLGIYEFTSKLK